MKLPDGMTAELTMDERTGQLAYHIKYTAEYLRKTIISILDERIKRAEVGLKVCKHTKRRHRLIKLYNTLIELRNEQQEKLNRLMNGEHNCGGMIDA